VGLRAGLDTEARAKILCLWWGLNPGCPVCSQTLSSVSYVCSQVFHVINNIWQCYRNYFIVVLLI
jgi:hypothetical protein